MSNQRKNLDPFFTESEIEIRSIEGGKTVVSGYAAKFNTQSRTLTTAKGVKFIESIAPGAFDGTDFSDVQCCFDHDTRQFLASEPNLRYGVDAVGLHYEYDHDEQDPEHRKALRRIQRRDAKGSSFQFPALPPDCYEVRDISGIKHRTITRFPRIVEFGPVLTPAYRDTTAFARSLDETADEPELHETPELPDPAIIAREIQLRQFKALHP
jgi:HK97 family phage prohead protease